MGELVDTKFRIFDCPICISEERAAYNRIRLDFIKLANEAAEQYETLYKQDGSIQKVVEKLGEQTHNCLVPALDYRCTALNFINTFFLRDDSCP